jgi:hypothetical protein
MASLSAHLLETGDHGRLGFRPDCPVCREERLFGALSSEPIVSRRAQAALATGALAVSLAAPSAVAAQEPDLQSEGVVAPEQPGDGSTGSAPVGDDNLTFDPGGDTTLPDEVAPPAGTPGAGADDGSGESGPLELEPQVDPDAGLVPLNGPEDQPPTPGEEAPIPPAPGDEAPVPPAPAAPSPDSAPAPPAVRTPEDQGIAEPGSETELTSDRDGRTRPGTKRQGFKSEGNRDNAAPHDGAAPHTAIAEEPSATFSSDAAQSVSQSAAVQPASVGEDGTVSQSEEAPLPRDARMYVVRPGDSLWSIAKRLLGRDASVAAIAREVARLWEMNADRIATGDPDLLPVSTRLRLR